MLPRDPDFFRKLFELRFGGPGLGFRGEFDADPEDGPLFAGRALDVSGGEASLNQLGRQGLGRLLIGG